MINEQICFEVGKHKNHTEVLMFVYRILVDVVHCAIGY